MASDSSRFHSSNRVLTGVEQLACIRSIASSPTVRAQALDIPCQASGSDAIAATSGPARLLRQVDGRRGRRKRRYRGPGDNTWPWVCSPTLGVVFFLSLAVPEDMLGHAILMRIAKRELTRIRNVVSRPERRLPAFGTSHQRGQGRRKYFRAHSALMQLPGYIG